MTRHDLKLSRRGFVKGSAGLTFSFAISGFLGARPEALAQSGGLAQTISGWVTIGTDNSILIAAPVAEMGQGVFTTIPMIVAEELDADWSKVRTYFPPPVPGLFGNPRFGGILHVVASMATTGYWDKVRMHGAQARRVLMQAAADKWNVPLTELTTEPSVVVHAPSGRKLSYGEIAKFAVVPKEMPKISEADLKKPSDFRIVGKSVARLDIPDKTNGSTIYGIDVQVPGMVYATMLRSPVEGGAPEIVDDSETKKIPGVTQTVKLRDAVAIVGSTVEAVFAGREVLKVTWKGGATAGFNSEKALPEYAKRARTLEEKGLSYKQAGDADAAFAKAAKVISSEFMTDYVHHAQMEPMNVTVSVNEAGDAAEIWMGSQAVTVSIGAVAGLLKTKPDRIRFNQHFLGGGFGRRAYPDLPVYGAAISREVKKPVKLIWTREQDVKAAWMRPQTAHFLQAALDDKGAVIGWRHRVVGEATTGYSQPARLEQAKGLDPSLSKAPSISMRSTISRSRYLREIRGTALAAWRAIGSGFNKFAIESFVDEIAREQGVDPVELRLRMLQKHPRGRTIIETVAEMSNWKAKPAEGRALGFAYADVWNTPVAGAAEISLDRKSGRVHVHRFWTAVNPGIVVNPDVVVAQCESNVIYGLGQALRERNTFVDGAIAQSNFNDYEVMRMSDVPEISVKVISTPDRPTGIGEIVLPVVAPAVASAIFALTGKRMRHLPFTDERVRAALS